MPRTPQAVLGANVVVFGPCLCLFLCLCPSPGLSRRHAQCSGCAYLQVTLGPRAHAQPSWICSTGTMQASRSTTAASAARSRRLGYARRRRAPPAANTDESTGLDRSPTCAQSTRFSKWACRDDPHARYRATLLQALTPNALRDAVRAQPYYTCHCARRRRTLSALDGAHNRRVGCTSSCDRHTHCNGYRVGTGRVGTQVTANPDATHVWLSLGGNDGIARLGIGLRP